TMDTTLPIITRYSGESFIIVSIFHGFCVDFSVPFLVTFFCSL
ncbi:MAG: LysO family transporter, partial [Prevotella sp.]|nr:LysO family transporter [Prevotella sp.]